ncbi:MAG: hypothetical protein IPF44_07080 [Betaproteobacteria bacterium]|jgi:hypothetical protein|nr:hypothetical protein [Betaproteobacteria bacterium]MBK7648468.1 hypothetical protein [Betaproteobacteria bacterium]
MMVGQKVKVSLPQLPRNHIGIRFDDSQGAAAAVSAPRGASGEVLNLSPDRSEALIELYWSGATRAAPGSGQVWRIWVKRVFFGQLFD